MTILPRWGGHQGRPRKVPRGGGTEAENWKGIRREGVEMGEKKRGLACTLRQSEGWLAEQRKRTSWLQLGVT